jgi:hypothetical protein
MMMKEEIPSRRAMLRGTLAVGCSLCVPAVLFGCDSKSSLTPTPSPSPGSAAPANPVASSPPPADPAVTTEAKKVPQASVQYQTQPKDEQKCLDCQHFIAQSNTCTLVEGEISSDGWCTLWMKKT